MVELAGRLRVESTVPLILTKLHDHDDILPGRCAEALTRIGTDSVVNAVAEQYPDGERHFRLYASHPLEYIHSDLALATCLRFLSQEKDRWLQRDLAHAALSQFSFDAIERVRQMLVGKRLSGEDRHLRDYLVETCKIMEKRFPEYDQWSADGDRERQEHERRLHELRDDPQALLVYTLQRMQKNREGDDEGTEQKSGRFAVGDQVRVKHGVMDIEYPELPLGGWAGKVSAVQRDGTYLVRWSEETLDNAHPIYRKRCERDGNLFGEYYLKEDDLELDGGGPLSMEQPMNIITTPLSADNQDDRIRIVFGLTSDDPLPDDSNSTELFYFNYLNASLTFPFTARFHDPVRNRKREVTVTGMGDDFPVDESFGVMCEVLDGGEIGQMPLSELEVEPGTPCYQTVDDYITWFVNAPEAGVDDDLDGD